MPRIDDFKIQNKAFKKKEYRSWDGNLLEKLKISPEKETEAASNQHIQKSIINEKEDNGALLEFKQGSNRVQTRFNQGSIEVLNQSKKGCYGSNEVQQEFNKSSIKVQENLINKVQIGFENDVQKLKKLINKLTGNERKIFVYVVNACSLKGSLSTGEILGDEFNNAISTTRNGRETAIKRLIKKGLLKREPGKTGANGILHFSVSELIKTEALIYINTHLSGKELFSNWSSNRVLNTDPNKVQIEFNPSLYSSSNINTTTDLPLEFKKINFDLLSDIGFSSTQLKQLIGRNDPQLIQESIYHFAFALEHNPKYKEHKQPLNLIMGVLRKGQGWFETNYRSAQEIAMEQFLKHKQAEKERLKNLFEEAFRLAFSDWEESTEKEEISKILNKSGNSSDMIPKEVRLRNYFRENIWEKIKENYVGKCIIEDNV